MSNPISTAVISYGMSGRVFHCPLLAAHSGFSLDGIVRRSDRNPIPLYPKAKIFSTVDDAINDRDIELLVVNVPNEFHFDFASRAMRAGKHVVVEKPFTVTSKEAEALINISKECKKLLTVFQNRRWDADFLTIKKILAEKRLGRIVEFEAHYDRFRNYIQRNTWKEEQSPGNGILYNLGSHMIDQALTLFGEPDFVDARVGIQRTGGRVDDFYDIRMEYNSSVAGISPLLVILKSSYLVREQGPRYAVQGELGSFVKYGLDPQEQALVDGRIPGSDGWGTEPQIFWGKINTEIEGEPYDGKVETTPGNYLAFYDNVYECIRKGGAPMVKPEESMAVIKIIEACVESNKQKKAVRLH
jgi:scyllo-inositol 2-dehydrogenase (NADP+)